MYTEQEQPKQPSNVPMMIAVVLVVAAVVFTGWSAFSWYAAATAEVPQYSAARDDVLRIGQQELVNFYSLDYKNPDKSFEQMVNQATGPLADTLKQNKDSWRKQIQDGKASLAVKVLDAAVSDLDNRAGTASMTAMLEFVTTPEQGQPVSSRVPMQAQLTRVDAGWKLSQAARIPLGAQN